MKTFHTTVFCVFWGAILLASCAEENVFNAPEYVLSYIPSVETNVTSLEFEPEGENKNIQISCNTSWKADSSESWIFLSGSSGMGTATLTITTNSNPDYSSRKGSVTVTCAGITKTVEVTQKPKLKFILSESNLTFTVSSGSKELKIASNQDWSASASADWMTLSKFSGSNDATVTVKVTENTSQSSRSGKVTFKTDSKSYEVTVSQEGATLSVTPNSLSFTYSGGTETVSVTSNQSWTASSSESWLTLSRTSGTNNASIIITAQASTSTNSRNGQITFSSSGSTDIVSISQSGKSDSDTHAYVDLGLPSGLLWATCNVGASSPEEYGDYFAWGETTTKSNYDWGTYKWYNGAGIETLTKYNIKNSYGSYGTVDNKTVLDPEDDAAHAHWGGSWRMPTNEEFQELLNNCTWTSTIQSGVNGYRVTSKMNGNTIFLPAAGFALITLYNAGSEGYYWSSSLDTSYPLCAIYLYFFISGSPSMWGGNRCVGQSVRPVCSP